MGNKNLGWCGPGAAVNLPFADDREFTGHNRVSDRGKSVVCWLCASAQTSFEI
jgi:hypothetical protein